MQQEHAMRLYSGASTLSTPQITSEVAHTRGAMLCCQLSKQDRGQHTEHDFTALVTSGFIPVLQRSPCPAVRWCSLRCPQGTVCQTCPTRVTFVVQLHKHATAVQTKVNARHQLHAFLQEHTCQWLSHFAKLVKANQPCQNHHATAR